MAKLTWLPAVALALVLVVGPAGGATTVGQPAPENGTAAGANQTAPGANGTGPPGVADGRLVDEKRLLDAHTSHLIGAGFAANGSASLAVLKRGVLVDVTRTQNRTVTANASDYRQSATDVGRTGFGRVTRVQDTWGNRTVEVTRTVTRGETSYSTGQPRGEQRLAGARLMGHYLQASNFSVTDTRTASDSMTATDGRSGNDTRTANECRTPTGTPATNDTARGERQQLYVLRSTGRANRTQLRSVLPPKASNPRNLTATVVVDEAGRIRSFRARVDYTIHGEQRTQRVAFTLQSLGVTGVQQPPWVDEALSPRGNATRTGTGG